MVEKVTPAVKVSEVVVGDVVSGGSVAGSGRG